MARKTKTRGVKLLEPGLYEIRAVIIDPKTGRRRELRREVRAASAVEANALRLQLRAAKLEARLPAAQRRVRLADALTSWLESHAPSLRPSTAVTYARACDLWIDELGDHFVDAIDAADVAAAVARWVTAGAQPETANGRLRVLRTWAKQTRAHHVVDGVRIVPKPSDPDAAADQNRRGLRLPELRRFLRAGPKAAPTWWPMLATLAYTGMRWGEASALRWSEVDLGTATVRIRRSQVRGHVDLPKTAAGVRDVALPAECVSILRAWRRASRGFDGLVFPASGDAEFRSNSGARKAMLATLAEAKIELGGRPALHCLRHAWNNAIRQVADATVRQSLVGHVDEQSGEAYASADVAEQRKAVAAAVRLVRRSR